jgi:hypothetical protein
MAENQKWVRMTIRVPRGTYQAFHNKTSENVQTKTDVVVRLIEKFNADEVSLSRDAKSVVRRLQA